jgi:hypothetical protein
MTIHNMTTPMPSVMAVPPEPTRKCIPTAETKKADAISRLCLMRWQTTWLALS